MEGKPLPAPAGSLNEDFGQPVVTTLTGNRPVSSQTDKKPTGIVGPSMKTALSTLKPSAGIPKHLNQPSERFLPLRKTDQQLEDGEDTSKQENTSSGFVPRNVVLSKKQKKLGIRPLNALSSHSKNQTSLVESGSQATTDSADIAKSCGSSSPSPKSSILPFNQGNVSFKSTEEVHMEEEEDNSTFKLTVKDALSEQVPPSDLKDFSPPASDDVSAYYPALSLLPPALRDKPTKLVSPRVHTKPVARVLPSIKEIPEEDTLTPATVSVACHKSSDKPLEIASHEKKDLGTASSNPTPNNMDSGSSKGKKKKKKKRKREHQEEDSDPGRKTETLKKKKKKKSKKHKHHQRSDDSGEERYKRQRCSSREDESREARKRKDHPTSSDDTNISPLEKKRKCTITEFKEKGKL